MYTTVNCQQCDQHRLFLPVITSCTWVKQQQRRASLGDTIKSNRTLRIVLISFAYAISAFFTVDYTGGPIGLRCPRRNLYEWIPVDKALPPLHEQVAVVENLWRLLVDCEMFTHLWKREKVCRNRFLITNHFAPVDRCMYHENSDRVLLTFT